MEISVIIPVRNEEENVEELYTQISDSLEGMKIKNYEIIFIDDGSTDDTFNVLSALHANTGNVKVIKFGRNLGKSAALSTGFRHANGDIVITMDGDLQDRPEEIPKFIEKINDGYDVVVGWRFHRKDPILKIITSKIFNKLTSLLTGLQIHDFNCGFKAFRKEVVKNIDIYGELHRYIPAIAHWKGYHVGEIKVKHLPRVRGKSKYGVFRIAKGFLDLITISFLMSFGTRPLHIFGSLGLITFLSGIFICSYLTFLWMLGMSIGDRPLLILGVLLIISGIQFISTGLIGEMIVGALHKYDESCEKEVSEAKLIYSIVSDLKNRKRNKIKK